MIEGESIENVIAWDYSSDVTALTEEAHITIDNSERKYRDLLKLGQSVEFILEHPAVNSGIPTIKHRGFVSHRNPKISPTDGATITITSSDLGWHLENNNAPLFLRLQGKTYADICDPSISPFFSEDWGFRGLQFDGDLRRRLKQGLAAVAAAAQRVLDPVHVIQVEAGDTVADLLVTYARRLNLLVNVASNGDLCIFRPDFTREPIFSIRNQQGDPLNNVLEAELHEDIKTRWTEIEVVGEQIGYEGSQDPNDPNASKKRGKVKHSGALPFLHRRTTADGEMFQNGLAQKHAEWLYQRGLWDSWYATYKLDQHHQNGQWLESDNMVNVDDIEFGLSGNFYIQSVKCFGSKAEGDYSQVTIRNPQFGILSAAFGELPNPPIYRASGITGSPSSAP